MDQLRVVVQAVCDRKVLARCSAKLVLARRKETELDADARGSGSGSRTSGSRTSAPSSDSSTTKSTVVSI